jgi:small subunit ribosomal protein S8
MSFTDPIGDLITRIRNAQMLGRKIVKTPSSKMRSAVLEVLKREGYIKSYETKEINSSMHETEIELKYMDGVPVISEISRVSKPGRRVYEQIEKLAKVRNGLGISILSTSHGVLSDHEARQKNVGGEVLIKVF